jgi:hypothetical protein
MIVFRRFKLPMYNVCCAVDWNQECCNAWMFDRCRSAFENEKSFFEKMEEYRGHEDMQWMPKYYGSGMLKEVASSSSDDGGLPWYVAVLFSSGRASFIPSLLGIQTSLLSLYHFNSRSIHA